MSILVILVVGLPAGFAFSKLRFRASNVVFLIIVSAMMVPLQAILMPEYVNVTKLGLTGGYFGAILVYAALGTPFSIFLFTTYFRGVPDELIEAGIVDGLGYFGALWRLVVPIAIPAIATVTVLQFIQIWDDLWSDSSSYRTLRTPHHRGARGARRRPHHLDSRADGRLAGQCASGDGGLPRLPALPGQGTHHGYRPVTRNLTPPKGDPPHG